MIFHENRLLAEDSCEISYLIFGKIGIDVAKFVVCLRVNGTGSQDKMGFNRKIMVFLNTQNSVGIMITYWNCLTEVNITEYNGLEVVKSDHHIERQMDNDQEQINKNFGYFHIHCFIETVLLSIHNICFM